MRYYHVDVFSSEPMNGYGLTVIFPEKEFESETLLKMAQELKQFETIFIFPQNDDGSFRVRIFTVEEELVFAGHPILGAGAVLHSLLDKNTSKMKIRFLLPEKNVEVQSEYIVSHYLVTMNQGVPQFIKEVGKQYYDEIASSLNMHPAQLDKEFPIEVVSTGLPYLLVPIRQGISEVQIKHEKFEQFLNAFGAKFVYVFETGTLECRTWDNSGINEDVATGSAAGPLSAYLVRNGFIKPNEVINISQGKYLKRPSIIKSWVEKETGQVYIQGSIVFFGMGEIFI